MKRGAVRDNRCTQIIINVRNARKKFQEIVHKLH